MKNAMRKYRAITISSITVLLVYTMTVVFPPGWASYLVGLPAYLILSLTALARANSIKPTQLGAHWDLRRMGLAVVMGVSVMYIFGPVFNDFPSWRSVLLSWGVSLVWVTTPGMPPVWPWHTPQDPEHLDWSWGGFWKSLFGGE